MVRLEDSNAQLHQVFIILSFHADIDGLVNSIQITTTEKNFTHNPMTDDVPIFIGLKM